MKLHFQNRVALFNATAAGVIIAVVYCIIFLVVFVADYGHLDGDIRNEKKIVVNNLEFTGDSISVSKLAEWERKENETIDANPVFIQVTDVAGNIIFRSANLQSCSLKINNKSDESFADYIIGNGHFRQGRFAIRGRHGNKTGVLCIAISSEESYTVLYSLRLILSLSYPLVLIGLYFILLFSVSKAIAPVRNLIKSAAAINDTNIHIRMPLPQKEDEIYQLAATINDFLGRIEKSMKYQKQFTADASHEMRTPLTAIRGILEVVVRKTREPEHYEKSIRNAIVHVDRMHLLMEQLLQLARLNSGVIPIKLVPVNLRRLLVEMKHKWAGKLAEKNIGILLNVGENVNVYSDNLLLELVLENLISNAVKYGKEKGRIVISWNEKRSLSISDDGLGISEKHLPHLFDRFYRTDVSRNSKVPGNGLGLSIVKKVADLLNIQIAVMSAEGSGTTFILQFSNPKG